MALVSALGRLLNALTQDIIPHIWAQAQRLLAMDLAFFSEFGYVYTSLSTQCRDRRSNYKLEMLLWLKVWEGDVLLNADAMVEGISDEATLDETIKKFDSDVKKAGKEEAGALGMDIDEPLEMPIEIERAEDPSLVIWRRSLKQFKQLRDGFAKVGMAKDKYSKEYRVI
ncbi:hypothetical protein GYMLUDRAFT_247538 [Collybiopsis luxurians FD-317 M1]|uniref:Uncharacterized protein n=1 Tax=Collybiopsis luxurians FD-317 M1 TaxID=944289 RepID=A0A0D0CNB5_9AGAR|nr:hypothetical protein GYMLUDRAFT_247538 [Collybiopsis luxurians FD-317 M1]